MNSRFRQVAEESPLGGPYAWAGYVLAVVVAAGVLGWHLADPPADGDPILIFFLVPIIGVAYFGGFGAGALATALLGVGVGYLLFEPHSTLAVHRPTEQFQVIALILGGLAISWLIETPRQSLRQHRQREQALAEEMAGRTAALLAQERNLTAMIDNIPAMIGCWDKNLLNRFANSAYRDWFGIDPKGIVGWHLRELLGEDGFMECQPHIDRVFAGESRSFERTIPRPEGGRARHALVQFIPDRRDGEVVGFFVLVTDISAIKAAQLAQQESEAKYQLLARVTDQGFWQTDASHRTIFANDAMARLLGYGRGEDLLGMPAETFLFGEDIPEYRRQALGQSPGSAERRLRRRDGGESWCLFSVSPQFDARGAFCGAMNLVSDFNAQRAAAQELETYRLRLEKLVAERTADARASEARFRGLVEQSLAGIFVIQGDAFRYANPALAGMFGFDDPAQMTGALSVLSLVAAEDRARFLEASRRLFSGETSSCELAFSGLRRDGERLDLELSVCVSPWEYRPALLGVVLDVSSRMQAQRALEAHQAYLEKEVEARTAQLRAVNQELQAFTYAASHDLKAPLRGISSFAQLLDAKWRPQLGEEGVMCLDLIRRNAGRMSELVDDLLAHARLDQQVLRLQAVDLVAACAAVLAEKDQEIRQTGAELRVDLPPLWVEADPSHLMQALRNLVENALKYSARSTPPRIGIVGRQEGGMCRVSVSDNGIGFEMKYHDRIFEIFRRLHTYDEYPGSGVGLALVRKAVESMRGKVWAESEPGQGATFHLQLPSAAGTAAPTGTPSPGADAA